MNVTGISNQIYKFSENQDQLILIDCQNIVIQPTKQIKVEGRNQNIKLDNCQDIYLDGSLTGSTYGMIIESKANTMSLFFGGGSKNLTVKQVKILANDKPVIFAKNNRSNDEKISLNEYMSTIGNRKPSEEEIVYLINLASKWDHGGSYVFEDTFIKGNLDITCKEHFYAGTSDKDKLADIAWKYRIDNLINSLYKIDRFSMKNCCSENAGWDILQSKLAKIFEVKNGLFLNTGLDNKSGQNFMSNDSYNETSLYQNSLFKGGPSWMLFKKGGVSIIDNCAFFDFKDGIYSIDADIHIKKAYMKNVAVDSDKSLFHGSRNNLTIDHLILDNGMRGLDISSYIDDNTRIEYLDLPDPEISRSNEDNEPYLTGFYQSQDIGTIRKNEECGEIKLSKKRFSYTGGRMYIEVDGKKLEGYSTQQKEALERGVNVKSDNPQAEVVIKTDDIRVDFK